MAKSIQKKFKTFFANISELKKDSLNFGVHPNYRDSLAFFWLLFVFYKFTKQTFARD